MTENITQADMYSTFRDNFKEYGMYTITDRALPDVRDGLKPVHRAILNSMGKNKIYSTGKPQKVAKITGDVIGTYHPHGDTAVEYALALMASPWKHPMPPITIKGNIGSVFGDPHAAGRYIEAKLSETGDNYVKDLRKGIVPYVPNYDDTAEMAEVMPARLPYLLINGDEGIATGFATSIPTHNPIEVIEAFIAFAGNQKITTEELLEIMPGPDYPTAGEIINKDELLEIYKTGLGTIRVRGKVEYNKKENALHITEIPATHAGSMDKLVEEITNATRETKKKKANGKIETIPPKYPWGIDVKNHSGKDGIDIKIQLKAGVNPEIAIQELYAKTKLENTQKFIFQALNESVLGTYTLKRYFKEYLAHQHEIIINKYTLDVEEYNKRMEVIKGLLILQTVIDEVITSAKNSKGKAELQEVLTKGKILDGVPKKMHNKIKQFKFSQVQAEYISNLPIYRISKMDYAELVDEGKKLQKSIEVAESYINSVTKRKNLIIKEHKDTLKKLNKETYARKTPLLQVEQAKPVEIEEESLPLFVSYDAQYGYVKISEKSFDGASIVETTSKLGLVGKSGIVYMYHLNNYKPTTGRGILAEQLVDSEEPIIGMLTTIDKEDRVALFIFEDGNMKVNKTNRYQTKTRAKQVKKDMDKAGNQLLYVSDIPESATKVKINDDDFVLSKLSTSGGHGRNEVKAGFKNVKVAFNAEDDIDTSQYDDGLVIFDGSDTAIYNWSTTDTSLFKAMFVIKYSDLLNQEVLFVHDDGTAKVVDGKQFENKKKKTERVINKKGKTAIYIGNVPETLLGVYNDKKQKRVDTNLITRQGHTGGGARTFYSTKSKIKTVKDGKNSSIPLTSLASQPK